MSRIREFLSANGSALRSLVRALTVLFTAFGLDLTPEQVGAIQLTVEAVLQFGVQVTRRV
jgi:hypothetical protein